MIASIKRKRLMALLLALTLIVTPVEYTVHAESAEGNSTSIDGAVEATVNADVYFVQASSRRVITLDGTENNPIDCVTTIDSGVIPDNAKFKIYYGDFDGTPVVNFTCDVTNTSWKADNDKVFQMYKRTNPGGWESVIMEPQGDGTVSFRSSANKKYITVVDFKLELSDDDEVSSNEKFIIYTETAPKKARNIRVSNVSGTGATVSWDAVTETLFSGYEVLYSTSENGEYKSAGHTAGTSLDVTGLKLNTRYYFKVRTNTNLNGGVYSDSAIVYATTLTDYKPQVPQNLTCTYDDDSISLTWDSAESAKSYKVYKSNSRYGNYTEIATVNGTSYTDSMLGESKFANYYKVMAANDVDVSELSKPTSIEIAMFGEDMHVFSEGDNASEVNSVIANIFEKQHYSQFGKDRYALAFKPGDYTNLDVINIGYYTSIIGLGDQPTDVMLNNVKTPCALSDNNATCNFWVAIENIGVRDLDNNDDVFYSFQWAVSQAAPARRLYVERKASFDWYYGWASGGYVADSYFAKAAGSLSQQQYYYRNCYVNDGTYGVNWNQVIQGCEGNTVDTSTYVDLINKNGVTNWNRRGSTTVLDTTDKIREKPFLYLDEQSDEYKVFVPALKTNSKGISWSNEYIGAGTSISVDDCFFIANPSNTAAEINEQLEKGKNIILQPGIYYAEEPIRITKANTIFMGLGIATIIPTNTDSAMKISDVGGVSVCGIIFDSGNYSDTLVQIGEEGCNKDHSDNPIVIQDVFYRVGGTGSLGRAKACLVVNSNDTIIDHTWIWRADHGDNTGWYTNTSANGMIVNGDNVTAYGLFVEHFQEYDVIWRGEYGKTYFVQNEKCYDPQVQAEWMSHDGTKKGFASYKVANNVEHHYAVGIGVYDVFINTNGASIFLDNAIEVPDVPGVLIENACIVEIANGSGPLVGINHIVNDTTAGIRTGANSGGGYAIQRLLSYNNNASLSLNDYYAVNGSTDNVVIEVEEGSEPTDCEYAEKEIKKEVKTKDNETYIWEMTDDDYVERIEDSSNSSNPTIENGIEINGYQISANAKGMRTVYSVDSAIDGLEVVESGVVYSLSKYTTEEKLFVGSDDYYVRSFISTEEGKFAESFSSSEGSSSYAMTMLFIGQNVDEYTEGWRIRAYAKLSDGSYVYSDAVEYTIYDVAKALYDNSLMNTVVAHNYLYTDILSRVNHDYIQVEFDYTQSIVDDFDEQ